MLSKIIIGFVGVVGLWLYWDNLPEGYRFFFKLVSIFSLNFVSCGIVWLIWLILTDNEHGGD